MKQYKIVKHYTAPDDYIYRIYKREFLFFWSLETAYSTIERCESTIAGWKQDKIDIREYVKAIPKPTTVGYYG